MKNRGPRGALLTLPLRSKVKPSRRTRTDGMHWDGSYGHGAGRAHYCVGVVACPQCGAARGYLCQGKYGPHLDTHVDRRLAYMKKKRGIERD